MSNLGGIWDLIDEQNGIKKEVVEPVQEEPEIRVPNPVYEVNEFEDPKPYDPENPPDPFLKMIDAALADSGVDFELESRRKYDPTKGNMNVHDWAMGRDSTYSGEDYQFRCKRCFKWLHVGREQTMMEAMGEAELDQNCVQVILQEVNEA